MIGDFDYEGSKYQDKLSLVQTITNSSYEVAFEGVSAFNHSISTIHSKTLVMDPRKGFIEMSLPDLKIVTDHLISGF